MAAVSRLRNREAQAERSRLTRRRIVDAACRLFVRDGYLQTTMADIAREAGVAVQTLYLSFGSKGAVLAAAIDVTIAGDDAPTAVIERDWHERIRAEPDGRRALDIFVATATDVITRFYPLYAAVRAAAADPEPGHLLAQKKDERFSTFSVVAEELSEKAGYREDLPARRAAEILYAQLSEETYGLLVVEHGWAVEEWSDWAARHVASELFAGSLTLSSGRLQTAQGSGGGG